MNPRVLSRPNCRRYGLGILALLIALAVWLPTVHLLFSKPTDVFHRNSGLPPRAQELATRQLHAWTDPTLLSKEMDRMRRSNAEWDFMGRTFLVWSLAEMSLRNPSEQASYLRIMDLIIEETVRLEHGRGAFFFLMPYARSQPYVVQPMRSLFLDGEIAMMLAVRRVVEEKPEYRPLLAQRIARMVDSMERSPVMAAESYPNECWLFDHAVALAAMKLSDHLDRTDHSAFFGQWLAKARQHLIHPETGLLVSSFTTDGHHLDGPEGSSIWMAAHCLRLIDNRFARDQYDRARRELGRELLGFAWSREWPTSWKSPQDVDSGAVIPVLEASAGGSGLALVGASSFEDMPFLSQLHATLDFAAFPKRRQGGLQYCASNQVGDAVVLYACVLGPIWEKMMRETP